MFIPDYQTIMLPLLEMLKDGKEYLLKDCVKFLTEHFKLSPEEQRELLPSGGQSTLHNRVGWARTYLKKAGLLDAPKRSYIKISKRGLEVLKKDLKKIDVKFLAQFPEFVEFQDKKSEQITETNQSILSKSPDDLIREAFQKHGDVTKSELIEQIRKCSPAFFESLVVELLVKMGYGGSREDAQKALVVGKSGDGGIDGVINEDRLGLDVIYIQAKRWENTVGRPQIQGFVGAMHGRSTKGVFITTSSFSDEAEDYAKTLGGLKLILINGEKLTELMIEHKLGVSIKHIYEIMRIDYDYFSEED